MNPKWVKHFSVEYFSSSQQYLLFEVWDHDELDSELIGSTEILFHDILVAPKQNFNSALVHKKLLRGTLKIKADFVNVSSDSLKIHFMGDLVSRKFLCCGFDNPYLLVERARLMTAEDLQEKRR